MASIWNVLDVFSLLSRPSPSTASSTSSFLSSSSTNENLFAITIRSQFDDIWRELIQHPGAALCCPLSSSIKVSDINREQFEAHIFFPDKNEGQFKNKFKQHMEILGSEIDFAKGTPCHRRVKILSSDTIPVATGAVNVSGDSDGMSQVITIFRINRPLLGGLSILPDDVDGVTIQAMNKYIAILRSFPETEAVFLDIDEYIKEVNFVGKQSKDGFSRVRPSIARSFQDQWTRTTNRLCSSSALVNGISDNEESSRDTIGQIIESYLLNSTYSSIFPWLTMSMADKEAIFRKHVGYLVHCTQSDLGITPEFQCAQLEAVKILTSIGHHHTAIDKLVILQRCVSTIRESVERNVRLKFPTMSSELELATDDLIMIVAWVIIKTMAYYDQLIVDIHYIQEFHFVSLSKSHLGFNLCHFEVAINWIIEQRCDVSSVPRDSSVATRVEQSPTAMTPVIPGDVTSALDDEKRYSVENDDDDEVAGVDDLIASISAKCNHTTESQAVSQPGADMTPSTTLETVCDRVGSPSNMIESMEIQQLSSLTTPQLSIVRQLDDEFVEAKDDELFSGGTPMTPKPQMLTRSLCIDSLLQVLAHEHRLQTSLKANEGKLENGELESNSTHDGLYSWTNKATSLHLLLSTSSYDSRSKSLSLLCDDSNRPELVTEVVGADGYFVSRTESGRVFSWGVPGVGRLGQSVIAEIDHIGISHAPRAVVFPWRVSITALACGRSHCLAVTDSGEVYAWGDNRCAQLGLVSTGGNTGNNTPSGQSGNGVSQGIKAPSSASTSSSSSSSASLASLPSSRSMQGISTSVPISSSDIAVISASGPVLVDSLRGVRVTSVACGAYHSLCLTSLGQVYSWGRAANGRLGQFSDKVNLADHAVGRPGLVKGPWIKKKYETSDDHQAQSQVRAVFICAGFNHSIALTSNGKVYSWGCGTFGRLGHGSHCDEYLPKKIKPLCNPDLFICAASAGFGHSVFLSSSGALFGCGLNDKCQIGHKYHLNYSRSYKLDTDCVLSPQPILIGLKNNDDFPLPTSFEPVKRVVCGDYSTSAIAAHDKIHFLGFHPIGLSGSLVKLSHNIAYSNIYCRETIVELIGGSNLDIAISGDNVVIVHSSS